jgi:hypothetical protein
METDSQSTDDGAFDREDRNAQSEPRASAEREHLEAMFGDIERRAARSRLRVRRVVSEIDGKPILQVTFGEEEARRDSHLRIASMEQAEALLALPFESYRVVPEYSAIFSLERDEVEATFRPLGLYGPVRTRWPFDERLVLWDEHHHPGKTIEIDATTGLLRMLRRRPGPPRPVPVVRFLGSLQERRRRHGLYSMMLVPRLRSSWTLLTVSRLSSAERCPAPTFNAHREVITIIDARRLHITRRCGYELGRDRYRERGEAVAARLQPARSRRCGSDRQPKAGLIVKAIAGAGSDIVGRRVHG